MPQITPESTLNLPTDLIHAISSAPEHPAFNALNWVLVHTSHPRNIGSSARAIKTMGFHRLTLIAPRQDKPFQNPEAIALASGAQDVLEQALELPSLGPALSNCSLVLGLTLSLIHI